MVFLENGVIYSIVTQMNKFYQHTHLINCDLKHDFKIWIILLLNMILGQMNFLYNQIFKFYIFLNWFFCFKKMRGGLQFFLSINNKIIKKAFQDVPKYLTQKEMV